jgi:arylformamidase
MSERVFLDYDQAELDRQYDQRAWAPNAVAVIERYGSNSDKVRARLGEPQTFAYGPTPAETLDVYAAAQPRAPIHVFIHGGAWRLLSKRESAFPAENFVAAGAHFVALDFALLPHVSLAEMVAQVRCAIAWVYSNAERFGGDRSRLYLSGHSSGAHLAANVLMTDWDREFKLPQAPIKGALCISGIYELEPVRLSARNQYLKLDKHSEHQLSAQRFLRSLGCPVVVGYGELESDEFKRQAREFADGLARTNNAVRLIEGKGQNHFEVIETLADADGLFGRIALAQMGLGRRADRAS